MVTANRKSTIDAHKKKNESKHNTEACHQSTREEKQRKGDHKFRILKMNLKFTDQQLKTNLES